jgi:hypothetical protein
MRPKSVEIHTAGQSGILEHDVMIASLLLVVYELRHLLAE